jgi:hypothetical protein
MIDGPPLISFAVRPHSPMIEAIGAIVELVIWVMTECLGLIIHALPGAFAGMMAKDLSRRVWCIQAMARVSAVICMCAVAVPPLPWRWTVAGATGVLALALGNCVECFSPRRVKAEPRNAADSR